MPFLPKEYRDKPELRIQLCDLNSKEDYAIWDNIAKAFIREGQMTDINGNVHELTATKFMPGKQFDELFPNKGKVNKVLRDVVIDGQVFTYAMPRTVDTEIKRNIATITAMGGNTLVQTFLIKKTGAGLSTRYTVELEAPPTAPVTAQIPQAQPVVESQPLVVTTETVVKAEPMTDVEKTIVDAIKAKATEMGTKFTFDQVKENFVKYNVTEERAKQIFDVELI